MRKVLPLLACLIVAAPASTRAAAIGYSLLVTTAYSAGDPFQNRIDTSFTEPETGYFQITNTGDTTFSGTVGTIARSAFAGDLSYTSDPIILTPGGSVSVAIADNSNDVGGFNGPAYEYRPGVQISLNGATSDGLASEAIALLVADADVHSGLTRIDQYGLASDSFVLQGGDPWGFQTTDAFALSQLDGGYVFYQAVPEPGSAAIFAAGTIALLSRRRLVSRSPAG